MAEYAEELWEMMQDEKTHVYMCGLKGASVGKDGKVSDRIEEIHLAGWRELVLTSAMRFFFPWGVPANCLEFTWTKAG